MAWEQLVKRNGMNSKFLPFDNECCVYIFKDGRVTLSSLAAEKLGPDIQYVKILSDGNGRLGFMPSDKSDHNAYRVNAGKVHNTFFIKAILVNYKILPQNGILVYFLAQDNGVLVLNTKQKPSFVANAVN